MLRKLDVFIVADFIDPDPFDSFELHPLLIVDLVTHSILTSRCNAAILFRKDPAACQGP